MSISAVRMSKRRWTNMSRGKSEINTKKKKAMNAMSELQKE
jgi:hypothetical protein